MRCMEDLLHNVITSVMIIIAGASLSEQHTNLLGDTSKLVLKN